MKANDGVVRHGVGRFELTWTRRSQGEMLKLLNQTRRGLP